MFQLKILAAAIVRKLISKVALKDKLVTEASL